MHREIGPTGRNATREEGSHQEARDQDRREQQSVEVGQAADREAGAAQHVAELTFAIAALVLREDVLASPQDPERGDGREEMAAGAQYTGEFAQRRAIVVEVFDHIERAGEVETSGSERQGACIGERDSGAGAYALRQGRPIAVDGGDVAARRELLKVHARTRAEIEDAGAGSLRRDRIEDAREDAATRAEPPVLRRAVAILDVHARLHARPARSGWTGTDTPRASIAARPRGAALAFDAGAPSAWSVRRWFDALLVFVAVAAVYLAAGQHTIYKLDGWRELRRLAGGDVRSDMHLLFMPVMKAGVEAGAVFGLSMHDAAVATSALLAALGVAFVHGAARVGGASRGGALVVSLAVAFAPGVAFFATVFERHGVFVAGLGLTALAGACFARRPAPGTAIGFAGALTVAYALHSTGALLGASYLPWAMVQAGRGSTIPPASPRRVLALGAGCGAIAVALAVLARRIGIWNGLVEDEGANARFFLVLASHHGSQPGLLTSALWNEIVVPFLPLSLTWLAAFRRPALRGETIVVAWSAALYLALSFLLLGDTDERGAYALPLAWPFAYLTWRALGLRTTCVAIAIAAALAASQIRGHDRDPLAAVASDLRRAAGSSEPFLLAAAPADFELLYLHFPAARPNRDYWDAFDAKGFPADLVRAQADVLFAYLREQSAAGRMLVLTAAGREELLQPVDPGRAGALVLGELERAFRFEPLIAGSFAGQRLIPLR